VIIWIYGGLGRYTLQLSALPFALSVATLAIVIVLVGAEARQGRQVGKVLLARRVILVRLGHVVIMAQLELQGQVYKALMVLLVLLALRE
jgi:hypothetical protein